MLLDPENSRSPWFTAPPKVVEVFRRMQKFPRLGDSYSLSEGVNTRGANDIFFLKRIEKAEQDLVVGTTFGSKRRPSRPTRIERELVYPLIQGKNFRAWKFDHVYSIVPHTSSSWKAIEEPIMKHRFPETYSYFAEPDIKKSLVGRTLYSESRGPFYAILEISKGKVGRWKVAWADISTRLRSAVVPERIADPLLGLKHVIVDTTIRFVNIDNEPEAYFLSGILNSSIANSFSYNFARPKGGAPFRGFTTWSVAVLPLPKYDPSDSSHLELSAFSRELHGSTSMGPGTQNELDSKVARLYGLSSGDVTTLVNEYEMLCGRANLSISNR